MQKVRYTLVFALTLNFLSGFAQTVLEQKFVNLQKGSPLPENLQSARTAVFLKYNATNPSDTINWFARAKKLHQGLVDVHVDAVAYYRWRDLNAGYDATLSYLETLVEREINLVIITEMSGRSTYDIYMVPTDLEDPALLDVSQPCWHTNGSSLENALETLKGEVRRTDLERTNFLISGSPEFFYDTRIFTKNRFESFQPDLKLDKLAVPLFVGKDPENIENQQDSELKQIMGSQYPFNYELVGAEMSEDLMQKAGFHYVLRYLHGEDQVIRTLLDYTEPHESPETVGYKYYFKHLITGDIYLGDDWDSQPQWQQALMIHLTKMRRSLKVE